MSNTVLLIICLSVLAVAFIFFINEEFSINKEYTKLLKAINQIWIECYDKQKEIKEISIKLDRDRKKLTDDTVIRFRNEMLDQSYPELEYSQQPRGIQEGLDDIFITQDMHKLLETMVVEEVRTQYKVLPTRIKYEKMIRELSIMQDNAGKLHNKGLIFNKPYYKWMLNDKLIARYKEDNE